MPIAETLMWHREMVTPQPSPIQVTIENSSGIQWLPIVALIVSLVALSISFMQYRANAREHRKNDPRLIFKARYVKNLVIAPDERLRAVGLSASNAGKGSIQVASVLLRSITPERTAYVVGQNSTVSKSDELPFRLEGYATANWLFNASSLPGEEAIIEIGLGNGTTIEMVTNLDDFEGTTIEINPGRSQ